MRLTADLNPSTMQNGSLHGCRQFADLMFRLAVGFSSLSSMSGRWRANLFKNAFRRSGRLGGVFDLHPKRPSSVVRSNLLTARLSALVKVNYYGTPDRNRLSFERYRLIFPLLDGILGGAVQNRIPPNNTHIRNVAGLVNLDFQDHRPLYAQLPCGLWHFGSHYCYAPEREMVHSYANGRSHRS